jgi:hypothetical protein
LVDHNTNDEILSTDPVAPSPTMVDKYLNGCHLQLLASRGDHVLVLVVTFQLLPKAKPMRPPV